MTQNEGNFFFSYYDSVFGVFLMTRVIRSFCGMLSIKLLHTDRLLADLEFIDGNDRMGGIDREIPLRDCALDLDRE